MTGDPMDFVDHYQQMATGEESSQLSDETYKKTATCSYISFASTEADETPCTGYPMFARFGFRAQGPLENVVFECTDLLAQRLSLRPAHDRYIRPATANQERVQLRLSSTVLYSKFSRVHIV
jgi:hypothetical protein